MSLRFTHYTSPTPTDAEGIKVLLWPSEALKYMTPSHRRCTWRIHLPCPLFLLLLLLRGDQRHIKSSWKMDGGKSIQMERKPANDGVKGKPAKMGPGEREPLIAHQSPGKPSCLSAHVQGSISQEARCCDGKWRLSAWNPGMALAVQVIDEQEDMFLLLDDASTYQHNLPLPTHSLRPPPHTHTQKTHWRLCEKKPREKEKGKVNRPEPLTLSFTTNLFVCGVFPNHNTLWGQSPFQRS